MSGPTLGKDALARIILAEIEIATSHLKLAHKYWQELEPTLSDKETSHFRETVLSALESLNRSLDVNS